MGNKINKRVLIVLYYYDPYVSGVTVYAKKLAESLVVRGHSVTILTSQFEKTLPRRETINGVVVERCPVLFSRSKGVIMPTFWIRTIQLAAKHDIVNPHLPMPDTGLSCLLIPKRKIVTTYQCDIRLSKGLLDSLIVKISFILMHLQLARSRAIVTLSNDYFMHSRMKRYIRKSNPIYPPINASEFRHIAPSDLLHTLGLAKSGSYIGYFGRVVYEKGIKYLFEAIPLLESHTRDFKILIGGEYEKIAGGGIKDELDEYISRYPGRIVFTGYLDDYQRQQFYSMIDVMVLPSIDPLEAFGIVQVEAMLCGTPVVASNLPGVREVVNRTGYGLIAEPRNSNDLAKQIIKVLRSPNEYKPNRKNVEKIFNIENALEAYENLF